MPYVERTHLGLHREPRRAILGASYTSILALQVLLHRPATFTDFILGSPSVPFDPEILEPLTQMERRAETGAFIVSGALEREEQEPPAGRNTSFIANVHRDIPRAAHDLARVLRGRAITVDGPHELEGEDHTTMKLGLISRGLTWLARRALT